MKRVNAEFASPSRPGRLIRGILVAFAMLSIGLAVRAVLVHLELRDMQRDIQSLQAQIEAARQSPAGTPVSPYDASAREMLRERDPTWMETLTALESVDMPGITVTAITMPATEGLVTVQLTVSEYRTLLEYMTALNGPTVEPGALRFHLQQARSEGASGQLSATLVAKKVLK